MEPDSYDLVIGVTDRPDHHEAELQRMSAGLSTEFEDDLTRAVRVETVRWSLAREVEDKLSEAMLHGEFTAGQLIVADVDTENDTVAAIVAHHGGRVPDTLDDLLALPGIGPYTARAVLAFAFERDDVGVLDTNVARVVARQAGRRLGRREAQQLADGAVPEGQGWLWNQSTIELGARVCRKHTPACDACPVAATCAWHLGGRPAPDPADGSAGTSGPQTRFEGSDRQGRGRLVEALRTGPVPMDRTAHVAGWPGEPARAARVVNGLLADGLAEERDGVLVLPG